MRRRDVFREALTGLRHRRLRSALCALGIAIGAAAVVAVVAIPASTQATLLAQLGRDGNLLTVATGQTFNGTVAPLPDTAPAMVRRIAGVQRAASVAQLPNLTVRRSSAIPVVNTNGIALLAADPSIVDTLGLAVATGRFLDPATGRYPVVVLGAATARALGIASVGAQIYLGSSTSPGGRYAVVIGILEPAPLAPELDTAALIGNALATSAFGFTGAPTRIYLRADPDQVGSVWGRLAATANPPNPGQVTVGHPSDLLIARATTRNALLGLALGLGAVALLVGGVGVANVMVVSVLERRAEIGIRRALGATRLTVGLIFLIEATLLCLLGAVTGALAGMLATVVYTSAAGDSLVLPVVPLAAALGASLLVGLVAGIYPALRAARLSPTEALRS
jgi:putative ABC transport system permease protein